MACGLKERRLRNLTLRLFRRSQLIIFFGCYGCFGCLQDESRGSKLTAGLPHSSVYA